MTMNGIIFEEPHLELIPESNGEKHRLIYDWTIIFNGETYNVPKDFVTDGASIPYALRFMCGSPYRAPRLYAALVHDFLYAGGDPEATRADADALYRDLQIALGISKFKAYVEYYALRAFGASYWQGN